MKHKTSKLCSSTLVLPDVIGLRFPSSLTIGVSWLGIRGVGVQQHPGTQALYSSTHREMNRPSLSLLIEELWNVWRVSRAQPGNGGSKSLVYSSTHWRTQPQCKYTKGYRQLASWLQLSVFANVSTSGCSQGENKTTTELDNSVFERGNERGIKTYLDPLTSSLGRGSN